MGAEFHRVVMAALAAGLLVIPGCAVRTGEPGSTGDGQGSTTTVQAAAPRIVSASLDATNSLKITFSEAMQPSQNVDPAKFKLTVGYYSKPAAATDKYSYTYYYYQGAYSGGYSRYYGDAAPVSGILSESGPSTEAVLLMGASFDVTQACQQIAAHGSKAGLYLHYSSAGSPTIEDTQGRMLPSVGAFWDHPNEKPVAGTSGPIPVAVHCN
ncbi:MAG: hypothetical protein ACRELB_26470 [Polyangiaceae bacterium]